MNQVYQFASSVELVLLFRRSVKIAGQADSQPADGTIDEG